MAQNPTGRQIAAARALLGISQSDLAIRANISTPTLKRMEASEGIALGLPNNVDAVRRAIELAGCIFIDENGDGPGVKLKKQSETANHLTLQIDALQADMTPEPANDKPSPKKAMQQLRRARDQNKLLNLKSRRAKARTDEKK